MKKGDIDLELENSQIEPKDSVEANPREKSGHNNAVSSSAPSSCHNSVSNSSAVTTLGAVAVATPAMEQPLLRRHWRHSSHHYTADTRALRHTATS